MKYLVGANFKMYKNHSDLKSYFDTFIDSYSCFTNVDLMIAPMTVCLSKSAELTKDSCIHLGAQNMHFEDQGAYTGETSPLVLKELLSEYVIIGHSERRKYFSETNDVINKKIKMALHHGIRPILCVGENEQEKELGISKESLKIQILEALEGIENYENIDIAYEPLRAIGTGKTPNPTEIQDIHSYIRNVINNNESRIIYGGSVNESNSESIINKSEVNGFLVGGASLDADKFLSIINTVAKQK